MNRSELMRSVRASSVGEVAWVDAEGRPQVHAVVALPRDDRPVLALTYAEAPVAREVAAAPEVALSLTEPRSTGAAFVPLLARCRPRLVEDPRGELFTEELLVHELRRYPPSRLLADSPLLRREHWWYLPRLVVELEVDAAGPARPRAAPDERLMVVAAGERPLVQTVRVSGESATGEGLRVHGGTAPAGRAVVFGQDASFPDLEQWSQWSTHGRWDGAALTVTVGPGRTGLEPRATILRRMRRQRDLERRCRAAVPA